MSASILVTHLALMLPVIGKMKTESLTWLTACFWHQALLMGDGKRRRKRSPGCQELTAMEMSSLEGDQLPGTQHRRTLIRYFYTKVQGDPSGSSKPIVDIDLKVAFYYKVLILKRNFHINVNDRF